MLLWFSQDSPVLDVSCTRHLPEEATSGLLCGNKLGGGGGQLSLLTYWKGPRTVCKEIPPVFVPRTLCDLLGRVPNPHLPGVLPPHRTISSGHKAEQGLRERSTALPL